MIFDDFFAELQRNQKIAKIWCIPNEDRFNTLLACPRVYTSKLCVYTKMVYMMSFLFLVDSLSLFFQKCFNFRKENPAYRNSGFWPRKYLKILFGKAQRQVCCLVDCLVSLVKYRDLRLCWACCVALMGLSKKEIMLWQVKTRNLKKKAQPTRVLFFFGGFYWV